MIFFVEPKVFELFAGMEIVAIVARKIDNTARNWEIDRFLDEAWQRAASQLADVSNAQSHPRIKAWGDALREVGVSRKKFPPSIEAMARRTLKGPEPFRINPVVDFYNAISLKYLAPAGAYDLDQLESLSLGVSRVGETFTAMGETEEEVLPEGEISYKDGSHILTRHFVWRQSARGLIREDTTDVLFVSEVLKELPEGTSDRILDELLVGLKDYFQVEGRGEILRANQPYLMLSKEERDIHE